MFVDHEATPQRHANRTLRRYREPMCMYSMRLFILLFFATTAFAEQLYVEDKLVLNVYAEPDQRSSRIATIQTGDAVEALERVDKFVRVQLVDGREGWVGASYLSEEPPAIVKLKQLQSAADTAPGEPPKHLTDEIARLKKQNSTLQAKLTALEKQASSASARAPSNPSSGPTSESTLQANAAAAPPVHADEEPLPTSSVEPSIVGERSYWWAWALAVLAAGGAGFFAGYETLGRRVRQRFGGVKVY